MGVLMVLPLTASAKNWDIQIELGKELFHENNCAQCHTKTGFYDPIKKTTKNFKEVRGWVKSCVQYFNVAWFPEEETAVTLYLNDIYYKYPIPEIN